MKTLENVINSIKNQLIEVESQAKNTPSLYKDGVIDGLNRALRSLEKSEASQCRTEYYKEKYTNIFTKEQIDWLINYESKTGLEPSYDPNDDFDETVKTNLRWLKNFGEEVVSILDYESRELLKEEE